MALRVMQVIELNPHLKMTQTFKTSCNDFYYDESTEFRKPTNSLFRGVV